MYSALVPAQEENVALLAEQCIILQGCVDLLYGFTIISFPLRWCMRG